MGQQRPSSLSAESAEPQVIELKFLGVPEIRLDGRLVVPARRASIGLLAYLALTKRAHPRENLATLLAGDTSEEHARKHLGDCVQSPRQAVELNPEQRGN